MTTRSWDFLGLNYQQPSELLQRSNYGEDIIIGIIDTGLSLNLERRLLVVKLLAINYLSSLMNGVMDVVK